MELVDAIDWPPIGMTLDEAAAALRVDSKTLRTLIKAGDFPARKVGVGWRIDPDAVKRWLDTREPKSPEPSLTRGWYSKAMQEAKESAQDGEEENVNE